MPTCIKVNRTKLHEYPDNEGPDPSAHELTGVSILRTFKAVCSIKQEVLYEPECKRGLINHSYCCKGLFINRSFDE